MSPVPSREYGNNIRNRVILSDLWNVSQDCTSRENVALRVKGLISYSTIDEIKCNRIYYVAEVE